MDCEYDRTVEPATPTGFKVYRKVVSACTLQDTVALSEASLRYDPLVSKQTWTSEAFAHDTETEWQVRTYRTIGGTDYERLADAPEASTTADAQGPVVVTGLTLGGGGVRVCSLGSAALLRRPARRSTFAPPSTTPQSSNQFCCCSL